MEEVQLSILIPAWNGWHDLEPCLRSILKTEIASMEVIVIDNASVDGTADKIARSFPRVRLHRNDSNVGHTVAVNQGIRLARGKYLSVLDADTVVGPGALERLLKFLGERPDAAIVAPRMYNGDGSLQETARNFPRPINGLFGRQSHLTRWFPNSRFVTHYLRSNDRNRLDPFEVEWVSAACMMFPASLVERIGFWDEGFHSYWVDADWCMRARTVGAKVYCVPEAEVVHHEQNRRGKRKSARRIRLFHESVYRFYRKHYTLGSLDPRAIAARLVLELRAALLILGNLFLPVERDDRERVSSPAVEELVRR